MKLWTSNGNSDVIVEECLGCQGMFCPRVYIHKNLKHMIVVKTIMQMDWSAWAPKQPRLTVYDEVGVVDPYAALNEPLHQVQSPLQQRGVFD